MKVEAASAVVVAVCLLSAMLWPFLVMRVQADSVTIYVDSRNFNDSDQDGSAAHPYATIQKGVDAAVSGDTIQVAAGVYYGEVDVYKSFISLVGQKGSTIINGNGTGAVGIHIFHTSPDYTENVSVSGFTVQNFVKGITLSRSIYVHLRDDSMVNNTYNFGDETLQVQDIDTSNTVDGKPIYFWVDEHDKQVPADAGFVDIVNSNNITVSDLNLTNNVEGLVLKNTTNSLIENVRMLKNSEGLYLQRWSNSNTIVDNTMSNNQFMGVYVSTSSGNTIENNSITGNAYGLFLDSTVYEVTIGYQSSGNTVMNNTVRGNTVANNSLVGVYSVQSEDNLLYDNDFVNNTQQVYSENSANVWDDGAEGNYWSDYATQYSNATEIGNSGVWDTPYVIDANNVDHRPLVNSATIPEFPSSSILIVWMCACLAAIMVSQRKRLQRTKR